MALHKYVIVLLVLLTCLINSCYANQFYVGGRDGWVPNPSEKYSNWAERMRFQVNDTLLFKYKKGSDSVLVVNKDDYDKCNTNNPIKKMDDGNSIFKFDHSGPFFFISGNKDDCDKGQKLIIVVLAIRPPPPSTPTSPTTPSHGPVASPPKGTPVPAPVSQPPTSSPVNGPTPSASPAASPAASHAPSGYSPSSSPTPTKTSPSPSPSGAITSPSPSSSGSSSSPTSSPPAPSTAGKSPPGSVSPAASGDTPADINSPKGSPPNTKNSAVKAFTTPSAVVLVSTLLTIAFGGFIV